MTENSTGKSRNPETPRITYLSLASVVSALAVVTLHTNSAFWTFNPSPSSYWPSANVIDAVFYFAVPVFFMVSGATLVNYRKRYNTQIFFLKRVNRTLIPFLFWSVMGYLFLRFVMGRNELPSDFFGVVSGIFNVDYVSIYWFFLPLFATYLLIPLVSLVPDRLRTVVFMSIAAILFIIVSVVPLVLRLTESAMPWPFVVPQTPIGFPQNFAFIFFALMGYLLSTKPLRFPWRALIYGGGIAGVTVHLCGTYSYSMNIGAVADTWKGYLNVPSVLYSIAAFVLIKQLGSLLTARTTRIIEWFAAYSFPVYLLHWFVIRLVILWFSPDTTLLTYRLLMPWVIIAVIIPFTWIIRRIPGGKWILP